MKISGHQVAALTSGILSLVISTLTGDAAAVTAARVGRPPGSTKRKVRPSEVAAKAAKKAAKVAKKAAKEKATVKAKEVEKTPVVDTDDDEDDDDAE